jgi:hypothetical protein
MLRPHLLRQPDEVLKSADEDAGRHLLAILQYDTAAAAEQVRRRQRSSSGSERQRRRTAA